MTRCADGNFFRVCSSVPKLGSFTEGGEGITHLPLRVALHSVGAV